MHCKTLVVQDYHHVSFAVAWLNDDTSIPLRVYADLHGSTGRYLTIPST